MSLGNFLTVNTPSLNISSFLGITLLILLLRRNDCDSIDDSLSRLLKPSSSASVRTLSLSDPDGLSPRLKAKLREKI